MMLDHTECEKLRLVSDHSQVIGEFLDWLISVRKIQLCTVPAEYNHTWFPVYIPYEELLADFFDIDLEKVEQERREMLETLRNS